MSARAKASVRRSRPVDGDSLVVREAKAAMAAHHAAQGDELPAPSEAVQMALDLTGDR